MVPFIDRPPTESEIERFRLFLSSYQNRLSYSLDEPVSLQLFKDVLVAAFNIPTDEGFPHTSEDSIVNRKGKYKIVLKSVFIDEVDDFYQENLTYSFASSTYWDYLLRFGITQQNYKEHTSQMVIASMNLIKDKEGNEFEKACYLFLFMNRKAYFKDGESETYFYLAQYPYFIDSHFAASTVINWLLREEKDPDVHLIFRGHTKLATFLKGYEDNNLIFEIKIQKDEIMSPLEVTLSDRKRQKTAKRNIIDDVFSPPPSEQYIKMYRLLIPSKKLWQSNMLQIERLSTLQFMEYGAIAALKKQREYAVTQFEELINKDAKEEEFQQLLAKNWWMFGNEYVELIGEREFALGTQQDFLVKRTADSFLEIIEIKRPLNDKKLIYKTNQRERSRSHYRQELSDAIAQVIDYIDEIENNKLFLYYKKKEDVGKIRAKIIIGRDSDEEQKRSLRNLNSSLHGIEILTYDQLLRIAKKSLEYHILLL